MAEHVTVLSRAHPYRGYRLLMVMESVRGSTSSRAGFIYDIWRARGRPARPVRFGPLTVVRQAPRGYAAHPRSRRAYPGSGTLPPSGRPSGEVNKFATLSIVFAFVFAPVGAVLGHRRTLQIKRSGERGRERAIVGLTISYVIIVLALIALLIWLLTANTFESPSSPG